MSDFWWQVQQQEEECLQTILANDPGYLEWLQQLDTQREEQHDEFNS